MTDSPSAMSLVTAVASPTMTPEPIRTLLETVDPEPMNVFWPTVTLPDNVTLAPNQQASPIVQSCAITLPLAIQVPRPITVFRSMLHPGYRNGAGPGFTVG